MVESFTYSGTDGLRLHTYVWRPEVEPKAVVQIAHGMSEHGARYERFARVLNNFGYAVYANDHRGHGKSIPSGTLPGHLADEDGWNMAVRDMYLLNQEIGQRHPGVPVILVGHSMGSFLVQQYMAIYGDTIAAAALSASNGPPGMLGKVGKAIARIEKFRLGGDGHSGLLKSMTFKGFNKPFRPNRTEFDWLSRDEAEVDRYIADPLCGFDCSVATWIDLFDALGRITSDHVLEKVNKMLPIYLLSGSRDPVGEMSKGVKRLLAVYEKHGFKNVQHKFYEGARHELLNEINRDEVMADFVAWANRLSNHAAVRQKKLVKRPVSRKSPAK